MIEKNRLAELMGQGATVYGKVKNYYYTIPLDLCFLKLYDTSCEVIYDERFGDINQTYLKFLYEELEESKDVVDFYEEFGNITRTETLSLPTWEEAKEKMGSIMFYIKTGYILFCVSDDRTRIFIQSDETLFDKPLTKANYIEACRLAKKLFLGEVEE